MQRYAPAAEEPHLLQEPSHLRIHVEDCVECVELDVRVVDIERLQVSLHLIDELLVQQPCLNTRDWTALWVDMYLEIQDRFTMCLDMTWKCIIRSPFVHRQEFQHVSSVHPVHV